MQRRLLIATTIEPIHSYPSRPILRTARDRQPKVVAEHKTLHLRPASSTTFIDWPKSLRRFGEGSRGPPSQQRWIPQVDWQIAQPQQLDTRKWLCTRSNHLRGLRLAQIKLSAIRGTVHRGFRPAHTPPRSDRNYRRSDCMIRILEPIFPPEKLFFGLLFVTPNKIILNRSNP